MFPKALLAYICTNSDSASRASQETNLDAHIYRVACVYVYIYIYIYTHSRVYTYIHTSWTGGGEQTLAHPGPTLFSPSTPGRARAPGARSQGGGANSVPNPQTLDCKTKVGKKQHFHLQTIHPPTPPSATCTHLCLPRNCKPIRTCTPESMRQTHMCDIYTHTCMCV